MPSTNHKQSDFLEHLSQTKKTLQQNCRFLQENRGLQELARDDSGGLPFFVTVEWSEALRAPEKFQNAR